MKKVLTSILIAFSVSPTFAQKDDTTRVSVGNRKVWIFKDKKKMIPKMPNYLVWTGIDVGINGWAAPHGKSQLQGAYSFMELDYGRSWMIAWNVFEAKIPLNKAKTITLLSGAGFEWNNYSFKQKIALRKAEDFGPVQPNDVVFVNAADPNINYIRTRLHASWFNVPLMLNFRTVRTTERKKQFNFTMGVVGGVRMGSSQREIYEAGSGRAKDLRREDFLMERFRATAMVRVKYTHFLSFYGSYTFTPLFKAGAPLAYPWSVGIAIQPY